MASTIKLKNGSGEPLASDLVQGEPALDLTNKRLYTEDSGGTVIEVGTNPTELQVDNINIDGNAITSTDTDGNITITPNGTGEVDISKVDIDSGAIDNTVIGGTTTAAGSFTTLQADTSLNVDGTVTADGLTVEANDTAYIYVAETSGTTGDTAGVLFKTSGSPGFFKGGVIYEDNGATFARGDLHLVNNNDEDNSSATTADKRLTIQPNGDISFYEDTGATAKFFWDASAESLGIGGASPAGTAFTVTNAGAEGLEIRPTGGLSGGTSITAYNRSGSAYIPQTYNASEHIFVNSGSSNEKMRIDSSGNLAFNGGNILTQSTSQSLYIFANPTVSENTTRIELYGTAHSLNPNELALRSNTIIFTDDNSTNERMRIDSSGNLLVGTTDSTPIGSAVNGTVVGNGVINSAKYKSVSLNLDRYGDGGVADNGDIVNFSSGGSTVGSIGTNTSAPYFVHSSAGGLRMVSDATVRPCTSNGSNNDNAINLGTSSTRFKDLYLSGGVVGNNNAIYFKPDGTNADMTLDASGKLLVGLTTGSGGALAPFQVQSSSTATAVFDRTATGTCIAFKNNGSPDVGTISITASSTSYNTSSDYRLKEDVQPMEQSIERVKALNPVNFAWKANGSRVDGFLAHEAQEVVPEAVTGEKDAVIAYGNITDAEGSIVQENVVEPETLKEGQTWTKVEDRPEYQGIDQSKLVPLLTGALQEAIARIETLEAQVATLQGN